jgi:hypothetical protein
MARDRSEPPEVVVLPNPYFTSFLIAWPAAVCAALTGRIALVSLDLSVSEYAGWFFLAGAPVAIWLQILRGRAARSIAEVLYDTEQMAGARQRSQYR